MGRAPAWIHASSLRYTLPKSTADLEYWHIVGVMQNGKVEILVNDQGHRITPSYVAFNDEERLIGDAAKNQYASNPKRTIYDAKLVYFNS